MGHRDRGLLINTAGIKRVTGVSQLFLKRTKDGSIRMILAKVTDYIIFSGTKDDMDQFVSHISSRFKISKAIIDAPIELNGCRITQLPDGDIVMDMQRYVKSIRQMDISRTRRKEATHKSTDEEYHEYRSTAGSIIWAGNGTLPQAAFAGSYLQQKAPRLTVHYLTEANKMLKELQDLTPTIRF